MTPDAGSARLVAGTSGDERRPALHPGPEPEWHLPAHVRDPAGVRERTSAQIAAGVDVLMAHTFLTHRRALGRVGEARRARELTQAAIVLAREAAEQGRDRRDQEAPWARAPVLVAGVLPSLGEDSGSGRLGSVDGAIARDLHDQAGLLADAGADLIVVEGPRTPAETAVAVAAVRSMGIETWAVIAPDALDLSPDDLARPDAILVRVHAGAPIEGVTDARASADVPHGVMFDHPAGDPARDHPAGDPARDHPAGDPARDHPAGDSAGGSARAFGEGLAVLLAAGATLLGISDGATPDRLTVLRAAIDAHEQGRAAARETEAATWLTWVKEGATRAPSGSALWLASSPIGDLPQGWDWTIAPESDLPLLPDERYRFVVCPAPGIDPVVLGRVLEPGGVLVAVAQGPGSPGEPLRMLERHQMDGRAWFIGRRR